MPVFEKIKALFEANNAFVFYVKPYDNSWNLLSQDSDVLHLFSGQSGFVFMPFHEGYQVVLPFDKALFSSGILENLENISTAQHEIIENSEQEYFENLVQLAKNEIEAKTFKKVVISRKIGIQKSISELQTFQKLLHFYPTAFRYLFFHPKIGLWMGATPEQLLKTQNTDFETVALAGTQLFSENLRWNEKEIEEQQLVTDYIISELQSQNITATVTDYKTIKAGNLAHIKATISGVLPDTKSIEDVLKILHPTPAVCGFPKGKALDFILLNENYNRQYYTGFLGEFEMNKHTDLFVNLRCLEVEKESCSIYVGCGITKDSDPKSEYQETQNKSETMRSILVYKNT